MKLPIPFLLYTTSLALVGFTGWEVYELLPLQKPEAKNEAHLQGRNAAADKMAYGGSQGPVAADWYYTGEVSENRKTGNRWWWKQLQDANFIGKPPPPPPVEPGVKDPDEVKPEEPIVPLENIFELSVLVHDPGDEGQGQLSHVVIRYKPESGVTAPEWYVRERQGSLLSGFRPGDGTPPPRRGGNQNFQGGRKNGTRGANVPSEPMPVSTGTPSVLLQKIWVQGGDDERRSPYLWPPFDNIRLVRVSPLGQSAFFIREPRKGEAPTEPVEEPQEEEFFKDTANLGQEMQRALNALAGKSGERVAEAPIPAKDDKWIDVPETGLVNGRVHGSRQDQTRFESEDDFLQKVYFDTYTSSVSSRRGLIVRNIDPALASRFGVNEQDVLLTVNNHPVKTKAEAIQFGKREYKKGVRTYVTTWLSGTSGLEVERIYQLPEK
ncbi:MAG: hypothetical protein KDC98_21380 [Planctomycetes bacterium]|nr:hypothetical protein [Planctomycetota bacterium]